MSTALYARAVFGASSVLVGVVSIVWRDSEMWRQLHAVPAPLSTIVAWCIAIAFILGGIAMFFERSVRLGSIVLGAVYLLFTLACIQYIVAKPLADLSYVDFFLRLSAVCGAIAVYAPRIARLGLGVCTVSFALAQVFYLQYTASLIPSWIPGSPIFWTNLTTAGFALAAIAMLLNYQARLAIRLMVIMIALFGLLVWVPRIIAHPGALSNWSEIAENYVVMGASWLVLTALERHREPEASVAMA